MLRREESEPFLGLPDSYSRPWANGGACPSSEHLGTVSKPEGGLTCLSDWNERRETSRSDKTMGEGPGRGGRGALGGALMVGKEEAKGDEGDNATGVAGVSGMWDGGTGNESRSAGTGVRREDARRELVRCDSEETRRVWE